MYNIANMKKIITTTNAPAPIGPYNQAVLSNGVLYMSGQIPLDPATMELIEGDLEKETIQVMENLRIAMSNSFLKSPTPINEA